MDISLVRAYILYEFKLGHSATSATKTINGVYESQVLTVRTAQRWFEKFRTGDLSLENEERGRPPSRLSDVDLKEEIERNNKATLKDVGERLNVHPSTVDRHLKAIGKVRKMDQWVPHMLTERNKVARLDACNSHLSRNKELPFLHRIVTCDEKWITYDNRRRCGAWVDADAPPEKFAKPNLHDKKVMVTVWWNSKGIIHYSFLPRGCTIDSDAYCRELEEMHHKLEQTQPALVNRKGVVLLHDNARPHVSVQTARCIRELGYEVLTHPPYSPDLSPTDYHLFKDLELAIRGKEFQNDEGVKNAFIDFVSSKPASYFEKGIKALPIRWQRCIESDGEYF